MIVHCYESVMKLKVVLVRGMSDLIHWELDSEMHSFTFLQGRFENASLLMNISFGLPNIMHQVSFNIPPHSGGHHR